MAQPTLLARYLGAHNIDICGLQEVRHHGSGCHTLENGYHFIWSGGTAHANGVRALLSPDTATLLCASDAGFAAINDRILVLRFHPNGAIPMTAIVAYAPTEAADDGPAKDAFYEQFHDALTHTPAHHYILVMGDFNATTTAASSTIHPSVGRHACPTSHSPSSPFPPNSPLAAFRHKPNINDNGHRLLDLCSAHSLSITHSFFPNPPARAYTWYSRNRKDCNILDYILVRSSHLSSVHDAFDRVNRPALWEILRHRGVPPDLLDHIKSLYSDATVRACVGDALSAPFPLEIGVKQGCPISPLLFNVYIDSVIRSLIAQIPNAGIQIGYVVDGVLHTPESRKDYDTTVLPLLLYADDITLLSFSEDALRTVLTLLDGTCSDLALEINYSKNVAQSLGHPSAHTGPTTTPIAIPSNSSPTPHLVHHTSSFKYLGSIMASPPTYSPFDDPDPPSPTNILDEEISRRISSAWYAFTRLTPRFWKSDEITLTTKINLYNAFFDKAKKEYAESPPESQLKTVPEPLL
ncbi:hypothetical protein FOA52_009217 [Chlamydomonas sp. UWO 241]|nr:hypothetical protein FOA52_009217 [Chlamydomonas sp. UWO 241]